MVVWMSAMVLTWLLITTIYVGRKGQCHLGFSSNTWPQFLRDCVDRLQPTTAQFVGPDEPFKTHLWPWAVSQAYLSYCSLHGHMLCRSVTHSGEMSAVRNGERLIQWEEGLVEQRQGRNPTEMQTVIREPLSVNHFSLVFMTTHLLWSHGSGCSDSSSKSMTNATEEWPCPRKGMGERGERFSSDSASAPGTSCMHGDGRVSYVITLPSPFPCMHQAPALTNPNLLTPRNY